MLAKHLQLFFAAAITAPLLASQNFVYDALDPKKNDSAYHDAADFDELLELRGLRSTNERLDALVAELAERIDFPAPDSYIDYRFYLIEDPSPLAFSLADGQIYLHTGLLARLANTDQVAAVLLHEMHHVAAHHQIIEGRERRNAKTAGGLGAYITGLFIAGPLVSVIASDQLSKVVTRFDFSKETEADLQAAQMLADAELDAARLQIRKLERELAEVKSDLEREKEHSQELENERELQNKSLQVLHQQLELERSRRAASA